MSPISQLHMSSQRLAFQGQGCARPSPHVLPGSRDRGCCSLLLRLGTKAPTGAPHIQQRRQCAPPVQANNDDTSGAFSNGKPEDEDDELDKLLGIGRYRDDSNSFLSNLNQSHVIPENPTGVNPASTSASDVQDTLADIMQMEVRRVRAKEDLMEDIEDRKAQMRSIGEEMKAALAREYELDRLRTEMNANYALSEAFQALDEVEAEVQRIKKQVQTDKADLAAWEAQAAEDRSRGLFFKSLYAIEKEPRKPVGKSIPGYWRKQREAAAAAAGAVAGATDQGASPALPSSSASSSSRAWDPEAVAEAASRPLSAASRQVRSPLRLYLFSYLSAFLALLVINDLASSSAPHVAQDALYGFLSTGLSYIAVTERQALGHAQNAMLEGIRKTAGRHSAGDKD